MNKNKRDNGARAAMPELLAPAGNLEKLKTAIHYGADAVYLGGKQFSLRAKAGNFSVDQIREGVLFAREKGAKVYVAVNVLAHNSDLHGLEDYLAALEKAEVDALIVSDPGILMSAKRVVPNIPVHLSTQANVTNSVSAEFWVSQGVSRLNLARELSLGEVMEIRKKVDCELEMFVHGAICISYSGRCMLSNYLTDRDANRGNCSHPCRFKYAVTEEKRPGQFFPVEEDKHGTYIFNSKDLCLLNLLPEVVAAGVDSLKIEGRMKSIFYVGGAVRVYRAAIDYLAELPQSAWLNPSSIKIPEILLDEIEKTGTRGITENFAKSRPTREDMLYDSSRAEQMVEPVAVIRNSAVPPLVEIRNKVHVGDRVEYMGRGIRAEELKIEAIISENGESMQSANPGNTVRLATQPELRGHVCFDIIRRQKTTAF